MSVVLQIFDCFALPKDEFDWDKHSDACAFINGLTLKQQKDAASALHYLRGVFGSGFLEKASKYGNPLAYHVMNTVAWARLRLLRFSEALRALEGNQGFDDLLRKLRTTSKGRVQESIEAFSVLELAYKFKTAGYMISFEPLVDLKRPDLKLLDEHTGEKIFAEITALGPSDQFFEANEVYHRVTSMFLSLHSAGDLVTCIKVERNLSAKQLGEASSTLAELATEARNTQSLQTIESQDLKAGIAPLIAEPELINWAEARGLDLGVAGPPISLDGELRRLTNKVQRKMRQLPKQQPSIIVVTIDHCLLPYSYDVSEIVDSLARKARQYPHLLAVAVHRTYLEPTAASTTNLVDGALLIEKAMADPLREQTIIVPNDGYRLTGNAIDRVCGAFG